MKILVAEDDKTSREFLQKYLMQFGHCDVVVDGMEALDAFIIALKEESYYDLVCLDIMMPKVDGVKVLKAIRDLERQKGVATSERASIIITTALVGTDFIQEAIEIGCDGYLSKPIDTEALNTILKTLRSYNTYK